MQQITNSESDLIGFSWPISRVYLKNDEEETISFIGWENLKNINIIFLETDGIDFLGGEPEEYGIILWQKDGGFSEELKNLISKSLILCSKNGLDINNLLQNCNISLTYSREDKEVISWELIEKHKLTNRTFEYEVANIWDVPIHKLYLEDLNGVQAESVNQKDISQYDVLKILPAEGTDKVLGIPLWDSDMFGIVLGKLFKAHNVEKLGDLAELLFIRLTLDARTGELRAWTFVRKKGHMPIPMKWRGDYGESI